MAEKTTPGDGFRPPETPTEQLLAGFWKEILEVDEVGLGDGLVALGGNSLVATMIANRMEEALDYRPTLTELFSCTVGELAQRCDQSRPGLVDDPGDP